MLFIWTLTIYEKKDSKCKVVLKLISSGIKLRSGKSDMGIKHWVLYNDDAQTFTELFHANKTFYTI